MPKVITREKDLTSAGNYSYSNFTVVVPGYINSTKEDAFKAVADENDVYTVSSVEDFEANIGLVPAMEITPAKARIFATPTTVILDGVDTTAITSILLDDILELGCLDKIYTAVEVNNLNENLGRGYLSFGTKTYALTKLDLKDANWTKADAASDVTLEANQNDCAYLFIVEEENLGADAEEEIADCHFGNKMAYELLHFGYTVLYKKIAQASDAETTAFWEPLKDRAEYDFRYVVTGAIYNNLKASVEAAKLCAFRLNDNSDDIYSTGRGDCFALIDIDENLYKSDSKVNQFAAVTAIKNSAFYTRFATGEFFDKGDGKYVALLTPSVEYNYLPDEENLVNVGYSQEHITQMPASFHYLLCAIKAARSYREWYAVSGYKRGVGDLVVKSTTVKFGDYAVNALQPRKRETACSAINVICKIRDNYYLWGNRTAFYDAAEDKSAVGLVASDFLNIRQLCTSIKKQLYYSCRRFTFDPNSDALWVNFENSIRPLLEQMKGDEGIEDYRIVPIKTTEKAKLKARIRIIPIEAVEDFDICLTLEDSITGTVVSFED